MRPLTDSEQELLERRRSNFAAILEERMDVLIDFMERLSLPGAPLVLVEAERFVQPLDEWMTIQTVNEEVLAWITARIGYFIGEYLIQRHSGHWFLNEIPDSRFFGHYVVGRFVRSPNLRAMVSPFDVAHSYVMQPPGRSLVDLLAGLNDEILTS